ncbi:hypothetical protein NUW58_g657 [Xylaria curta]|uniref:Uncharacterized protein n=1 Tax=Xylaria curta TaxID=42375 RepID=A0ACC1PQ87_9PEZI|nr:hypothetical protein NUW58_g657 [Xylaria curta]
MAASRVWLITGASAGIGLELAKVAARCGDCVIAATRSPDKPAGLEDKVTKYSNYIKGAEIIYIIATLFSAIAGCKLLSFIPLGSDASTEITKSRKVTIAEIEAWASVAAEGDYPLGQWQTGLTCKYKRIYAETFSSLEGRGKKDLSLMSAIYPAARFLREIPYRHRNNSWQLRWYICLQIPLVPCTVMLKARIVSHALAQSYREFMIRMSVWSFLEIALSETRLSSAASLSLIHLAIVVLSISIPI